MFDFQKEVVINSKKAFDKVAEGVFRVDGMNYKVANVVDKTVYKTAAVPGEKATVTIKLSDIQGGKKQVRIELGLDRDYRGEFGSALYYFRKPILIDFRDAATIEDLKEAAKIVAASNGGVLRVKEESDSQIVFEATDDYITVRNAVVVTFDCVGEYCGDEMEAVVAEDKLDKTANVVSFGTYEYLIHNLRLPTYENLRFTSPAAVEAPVLGGEYTQFSFEYAVPRRIGGVSVVGQVNYSSTGHTFYVLSSIAEDFEKMLKDLKIEVPQIEKGKFIGAAPEVLARPSTANDEAAADGK